MDFYFITLRDLSANGAFTVFFDFDSFRVPPNLCVSSDRTFPGIQFKFLESVAGIQELGVNFLGSLY